MLFLENKIERFLKQRLQRPLCFGFVVAARAAEIDNRLVDLEKRSVIARAVSTGARSRFLAHPGRQVSQCSATENAAFKESKPSVRKVKHLWRWYEM
jgi:hypothetical protein